MVCVLCGKKWEVTAFLQRTYLYTIRTGQQPSNVLDHTFLILLTSEYVPIFAVSTALIFKLSGSPLLFFSDLQFLYSHRVNVLVQ